MAEFTYQGLWSTELSNRISIKSTAKEAVSGSHAIVVLTEWDEFASYDYKEFYSLMEKPSFVFDGRNILRKLHLEELGFKYHAIGQKIV